MQSATGFKLRRSDGSRLLYDQNEDCLYSCWGNQKNQIWNRYFGAIAAGKALRKTEMHQRFGGSIELTEYADPMDGSTRFGLEIIHSEASTRYIDYPNHKLAETRYLQSVRNGAKGKYPYKSSDVGDVPVNYSSPTPRGLVERTDGTIMSSGDFAEYQKLFGPVKRRR